VAEYFASDSFAQSVAMAGKSYASNGGVQFTYSSAGAFSYGQGAQRSLESQLFDSYDFGGRSRGLAAAKAQAHLSGANVTSGVIRRSEGFDSYDKDWFYHKFVFETEICPTQESSCTFGNVTISSEKNHALGSDGVNRVTDNQETGIWVGPIFGGNVITSVDLKMEH
jgi:hypothetical protein